MIKKSVFEDELIHGMQRELHSYEKKQGMQDLVKAAEYLNSAVEIFEQAGMTAKANQVLRILKKIATKPGDVIEFKSLMKDPDKVEPGDTIEFSSLLKDDKSLDEPSLEEFSFESLLSDDQDAKSKSNGHTKGLTSEKMLENLKNHGIMFNLTDDGAADDFMNAEIGDEPLEVMDEDPEKTFEDSH